MLTLGNPLPSGWHEIRGESGRTALMWSLSRLRPRNRLTALVQCAEPYDYQQVASWSGFDSNEILVIEPTEKLLEIVVELCKTGEFGQVIFEGLGFLIGSGKMLPEVERMIGDISNFSLLTGLARQKDIALYVAGQSASNMNSPRGTGKERPLGGRLIAELCVDKRLELKRESYLTRHGQRTGERYKTTNLSTGEVSSYDLKYEQGPIKERI